MSRGSNEQQAGEEHQDDVERFLQSKAATGAKALLESPGRCNQIDSFYSHLLIRHSSLSTHISKELRKPVELQIQPEVFIKTFTTPWQYVTCKINDLWLHPMTNFLYNNFFLGNQQHD